MGSNPRRIGEFSMPYTCSIGFDTLEKDGSILELGIFSLFVKDDDPIFEPFDFLDLQIVEEKNEEFKIFMRFYQLEGDESEEPEIATNLSVRFEPEKTNEFIKLIRRFALKLKDNLGFYYLEVAAEEKKQKMLINAFSADIFWKGYYEREEDNFRLVSEEGNPDVSS